MQSAERRCVYAPPMFRLGGSVGPVGVHVRVTEKEFVSVIGFCLVLGVVVAVLLNLTIVGIILVVCASVMLLLSPYKGTALLLGIAGLLLWLWVGPVSHDYFEYGREVPEVFDMNGTTVEEARGTLRELGFHDVRVEDYDMGLDCTVISTEPKAGETADVREPITIIRAC